MSHSGRSIQPRDDGRYTLINRNDGAAATPLSPPRPPATSTKENSPNTRPPPKRQAVESRWTKLFLNTWFWELVAIVFSAASLIALAVVIRAYNGKATPELRFGLTLNAVVSILATASKSSLLFAVGAAFGQLKWCWFSKSRRLLDLQSYDEASRGPLGSVTILFSLTWKPLASIAALITILALAYDPFIQQVLDYPIREVHKLSPGTITGKNSVYSLSGDSAEWKDAISSGAWTENSQFEREPPCSSGNCTWPSFESVGWCSKCVDLTTSVHIGGCDISGFWKKTNGSLTCGISIPYGNAGLDYGSSTQVVECGTKQVQIEAGMVTAEDTRSASYCSVKSDVTWQLRSFTAPVYGEPLEQFYDFEGITNPALVLAHASMNYTGITPNVQLLEACALTPCTRTYSISTHRGVTDVGVTSIDYGLIQESWVPFAGSGNQPDHGGPVDCWQARTGNVTYTQHLNLESALAGSGDGTFTEFTWTNASIPAFCPPTSYSSAIEEVMSGDVSADAQDSERELFTEQYWRAFKESPGTVFVNSSSEVMQRVQATNLSHVASNVAASLTQLGLKLSNETITGNVTTVETYVRVSWAWLILPIALEVLAVFLLVVTIILTRIEKIPLWKSSILAVLYHGIPEHELDRPLASDMTGMERAARGTLAELARERGKADGPRLKRT